MNSSFLSDFAQLKRLWMIGTETFSRFSFSPVIIEYKSYFSSFLQDFHWFSSTYIYKRKERVMTVRESLSSSASYVSMLIYFFSSLFFSDTSCFSGVLASLLFFSLSPLNSSLVLAYSIPKLFRKDFFPLVLFFVRIPILNMLEVKASQMSFSVLQGRFVKRSKRNIPSLYRGQRLWIPFTHPTSPIFYPNNKSLIPH